MEYVYHSEPDRHNFDIYSATKAGDLARVRYLVEFLDVDINQKNEFDAIPLFYACLCGHKAVVEYLLGRGARFDAGTFEAERCYYGALNDEIKEVLSGFKAKPKPLDVFVEDVRSLLADGLCADVSFVVEGQRLPTHRYVLGARCDYFLSMFRERWAGRREVYLRNHLIRQTAFEALLVYLYTGTVNVDVQTAPDLLVLCKQCKLLGLERAIGDELERPGAAERVILTESSLGLVQDLRKLWQLVRADNGAGVSAPFADLSLEVDGGRFRCHAGLLAARSAYFRSLILGRFREGGADVVRLHQIGADVLAHVLEFLYTNTIEAFSCDLTELLDAANLLLLNELKRLCCLELAKYIDAANALALLAMSSVYGSSRLGEAATRYVAENLSDFWRPDAGEWASEEASLDSAFARLSPFSSSEAARSQRLPTETQIGANSGSTASSRTLERLSSSHLAESSDAELARVAALARFSSDLGRFVADGPLDALQLLLDDVEQYLVFHERRELFDAFLNDVETVRQTSFPGNKE